MKDRIFSNWHLRRWVGLMLGLVLIAQGIVYQEAVAGILAMLFLVQAIGNVGCFGAQGCVPANYPPQSGGANTEVPDDISFKEIK